MAQGTHAGISWAKLILRWAIYVVLSLLLLYEATHCSLIEECSGVEAPAGALSHSDYTTIVKYGSPRKAKSHRVVLVTISSGTEPDDVVAKVCLQRLFTARLIKRLNDLNASVIAFDKFYGAHSCPLDGVETQALFAAIKTSRAVVTRGLPTSTLDNKQKVSSMKVGETQKMEEREVCLRETETLELPMPASHSGLLRLDADTRRIPLQWPVFQRDGKTVELMDSFPLITVRAADPEALETPVLQTSLATGTQPYSTMMPFAQHSALAILCGRTAQSTTDWKTCTTEEPWADMNGAIVVVGDHIGDADKHPSLQGIRYGVDLQANYIAALLDQRYYLPLLGNIGNSAFIVVFFLILQVILWKHGPMRAGIFGISVWFGILIISILVFAFRGYLLTVWVQGINLVTVIVSCLEHWCARLD